MDNFLPNTYTNASGSFYVCFGRWTDSRNPWLWHFRQCPDVDPKLLADIYLARCRFAAQAGPGHSEESAESSGNATWGTRISLKPVSGSRRPTMQTVWPKWRRRKRPSPSLRSPSASGSRGIGSARGDQPEKHRRRSGHEGRRTQGRKSTAKPPTSALRWSDSPPTEVVAATPGVRTQLRMNGKWPNGRLRRRRSGDAEANRKLADV